MTIEEIKLLKPGDKFWIDVSGSLPEYFVKEILKKDTGLFDIIEVEFVKFPENCWYKVGTKLKDIEDICWFEVKVNNEITKINTVNMEFASTNKDFCQAQIMNHNIYEIKTNLDKQIYQKSLKLYPEVFI